MADSRGKWSWGLGGTPEKKECGQKFRLKKGRKYEEM